MSEDNNSNRNLSTQNSLPENANSEIPDILNTDFFKSFEPQKKLPEKKAKISALINFLKENSTYLSSLNDQKKLLSLYDIILTNLIENNNNFVISQINLIELLSVQIINSENDENKNDFIAFYKKALPKLFDKFYLQNQKINENLVQIFDNSIKRDILKLKDYFPLIENICIEEDDEYKTNILNFLYEQIIKDENIFRENMPKNIIEAINKSVNDEENESLAEISKKIIDLLNSRIMKKEEMNNVDNNKNNNNNLLDIPNNPLNQQDSKLAFSSFIKKISNAVKQEKINKQMNMNMINNNFENLDNDINMNILNNDNKEEILTSNLVKKNSFENNDNLLSFNDKNQLNQINEETENKNEIEFDTNNNNENENVDVDVNANANVLNENANNINNNLEQNDNEEEMYENYVVTKENKNKFGSVSSNPKEFENINNVNSNDNVNANENDLNDNEINYVVQKGDKKEGISNFGNMPKKIKSHINRKPKSNINKNNQNQNQNQNQNEETPQKANEIKPENDGGNINSENKINEPGEQKTETPIQNVEETKINETPKEEENTNKVKDIKEKKDNEKDNKKATKKDDGNKKGYKSRITRSRKLGVMAKPNNKDNKDAKDKENKNKQKNDENKTGEKQENEKDKKFNKISVNKTKIKEKEKEKEKDNEKEIESKSSNNLESKMSKEKNKKNDFNVEILVKAPGNNTIQVYNDEMPIKKSESINDNNDLPIKTTNSNSIKDFPTASTKIENYDDLPIRTLSNKNLDQMGGSTMNFDDMPVGGSTNNFDDMPIHGANSNQNFDDMPIHGANTNKNFDDMPISGSVSNNLDDMVLDQSPINNTASLKAKSIDEFNKKIELALQQEQEQEMNKDTGNSNMNNKAAKKEKDDPKFDELKSLLGDEICESLSSPKWEMKKHAFELINNFVVENEPYSYNVNDLFEFIKIKLKNFKETNFNIIREAMSIYISMLRKRILTKDNLLLLLNNYYEKISDIKLKDNIIELINTSTEEAIIDLSSLISNLIAKILKKNNVKILNEYATLFGKMVEDYDIKDLPVKELINYCKYMAGNSNPQVRTSATNLICTIYKYVGEDVKVLIKDIKESTLKIIEAELEKVVVIEKKQTKKKKMVKNKSENGDVTVNKKKSIGNLELVAPVDISKKLTSQLIKDLSEGKWIEKKEACETIEKILNDANMKILPIGLNDLFNVIKTKLSDGNKNLVKILISLVNKFIQALKKEFKPWTKMIALSLIPNLSDKNQMIRSECQLCFEKWVELVGIDTLVIYFPQYLKNDNVEIRIEIMKFIKKYNDKFPKNIAETVYKELIDSLLICLQDRSNNVRSEAEDIIQLSLSYVNIDNYYKKAADFKPAIAKDLKTILDNILENRYEKESSEINNENKNLNINIDANITNLNKQNNQLDSPTFANISIKEKLKNSIKMRKIGFIDNNNNTHNNLSNIGSYEDKMNNYNSDYMSGEEETEITHKNTTKERNITGINSSNAKRKKNINKISEKEKFVKSTSKLGEAMENATNKGPLSSNSTVLRSNKKANNSMEKKQKIQRRNTLTKNTKFTGNVFSSNNIKLPQSKAKRLELDKKFKFTIDTMTKDDINKIKELAKILFSEEFGNKIFDNDFKKQVEALKKMKTNLDQRENINLYLDNLDIILKVIGIKITNVINPSLIKNLFLFLDSLYIIINENDYKISDIESNIILCVLIDKLSLNNNQLKDHLSNLINQYMELFDINKSGLVILNYALNKNNKMKSNVLDMIIELYLNKKINIKSKYYVKILSKYLLVNDNIVKSKCINIFREIQEILKDELWNMKEIGEKERTILENNLLNNEENEDEDNDNNNQEEEENNENEDENYNEEENEEDNMDEENREEEGYNEEGENNYNNYDEEDNNMNNNNDNFNSNYNSDNDNNYGNNNYNNKEYEENDYNNEVMSDNDYENYEDNKQKPNNYYVKTDNKMEDKRKIENYNQKKQIFYKNNDIISKIHKLQNAKNMIQAENAGIKKEDSNKINDNKFVPKKIIVKQKKSGGIKNPKAINVNTTNNNKTNSKNLNLNSNNINNNYINNNIINNYYNNNNSIPNNDLSLSLYNNMNANNNQNNNINNNNNIINNNISSNSTITSDKELLEIMNNLFSEDESEKMNTIIIIHEILCSKYQQNKFILIPNIDNIIKIIIQITHDLFEYVDNLNNKIIPLKFAKYLVTILCKLTSNKELIIHISYKVLYDLCFELLNYLLINGLDKIGTNHEGNIIFKSLNSAMLRVIENCDTTSVILALLEIIKQNKNNNNSNLLCNLAIKCLLKTTQNIHGIINNIQLDKILLQMHLLTFSLDKLSSNNMEQNSQSDIMIIRYIKNFIIDVVKIKKTDIMEDYNKSIGNNQYKDKYIYNWIRSTLDSIGCSLSGDDNEMDNNDNNINSDDNNEIIRSGTRDNRSTSTNINKNRINNSDKKRDSAGFIAEANKTVSGNLNKKSSIIIKKHGNNSINTRYNNLNSHNIHSNLNNNINVTKSSILGSSNITNNNKIVIQKNPKITQINKGNNKNIKKKFKK